MVPCAGEREIEIERERERERVVTAVAFVFGAPSSDPPACLCVSSLHIPRCIGRPVMPPASPSTGSESPPPRLVPQAPGRGSVEA